MTSICIRMLRCMSLESKSLICNQNQIEGPTMLVGGTFAPLELCFFTMFFKNSKIFLENFQYIIFKIWKKIQIFVNSVMLRFILKNFHNYAKKKNSNSVFCVLLFYFLKTLST
jgi:hypothetical protein